jgi:hypothetical protein
MRIETNVRAKLKTLVASQLPEFIRAEYPTFVAFVEAYYDFLDKSNVDLSKIRDIDETLDEFVKYFKAELAHNYPLSDSVETEKYLLKNIKDQYLSKGSEASYKLLFRLLYGRDVYMDYPGKQMLRVSDGRWQQDVSLFVRVDIGDPSSLVGKSIDIQTSKKIVRTSLTNSTAPLNKITANVEKVVQFSENVYEFFLDRNFYGSIIPGDTLKYKSEFQGQILPCTARIRVQEHGIGFKPGQVFEVSSGDGTAFWFKVTKTDDVGGLVNLDIIRFAIGYDTDFSVTVLPSSAVSTRKTKTNKSSASITYSLVPDVVGSVNILSGGSGYTQTPTVLIGGNGTGATAHAVVSGGVITDIVVDTHGTGYTTAFVNIIPQVGDTGSGADAEAILGIDYSYEFSDGLNGFTEGGYLNYGDYWSSEYSDGAYVGTIARQFFVDAKDTLTGNPALLNVSLGAIAKYPGYYKTNDGFLDDSMFIQDSYYYQAFSYVIRIDKQLDTYASVVRSMLHPSGMMMFGEYSIQNDFGLSVALEALIKSLGVTLYDTQFVTDEESIKEFTKDLSDSQDQTDGNQYPFVDNVLWAQYKIPFFDIIKKPDDDSVTMTVQSQETVSTVFKSLGLGYVGETTFDDVQSIFLADEQTLDTTLSAEDDVGNLAVTLKTTAFDEVLTHDFSKAILDSDSIATMADDQYPPLLFDKVINNTDSTIDTISEDGYVIVDPYAQGGYALEEYANGWASTFN